MQFLCQDTIHSGMGKFPVFPRQNIQIITNLLQAESEQTFNILSKEPSLGYEPTSLQLPESAVQHSTHRATPARQTESDPAPTTLFPLFYFWVVPVRLGPPPLPTLTPDCSPPRPPILARLDPHTPRVWSALALNRGPPWFPTVVRLGPRFWPALTCYGRPLRNSKQEECSTISSQSTQGLLTPNVAGAVAGIRTHVTAIAWVSRPALNPPRHKSTPAARQTESDPAPTTILCADCFTNKYCFNVLSFLAVFVLLYHSE